MKNTTKLRHVLQLYTILMDMDEDLNFHLNLLHKRDGSQATFSDPSYTVAIGKAFSHMKKKLKEDNI